MDLAAVAPLIPRWKLWSPISSSGAGDAARCARSRHGFSSARRSAFDGSGRGEKVYADLCAKCHKDDGLGERNKPPRPGYSIPPLRGDDSFNAATIVSRWGRAWKLAHAAAYIRANMPYGVRYLDPVLSEQQACLHDLQAEAADPAGAESELRPRSSGASRRSLASEARCRTIDSGTR